MTQAQNKLLAQLPVRVPDNAGIVVMMCDDPLRNSYAVAYREMRRRGIPFTLNTPGVMSSFVPLGVETDYVRMTDEQFTEILTRGGGTYIFHSNSHQFPPGKTASTDVWDSYDNELSWWKNEVLYADYGQRAGAITRPHQPTIDLGGLNPGARAAAILAAIQSIADWAADTYDSGTIRKHVNRIWQSNKETAIEPVYGSADWDLYYLCSSTTTAEWVTAQGFAAPGHWMLPGGVVDMPLDSKFFSELTKRWGRNVMLYQGKPGLPIPHQQQGDVFRKYEGIPSDLNTDDQNKAFIDRVIANKSIGVFFSHEWLDDGETTSTDGGGSAKPGKTPNTDGTRTPTFAKLIVFLDYLKEKMDSGDVVAMGLGGAFVAERGTPVDALRKTIVNPDGAGTFNYTLDYRQLRIAGATFAANRQLAHGNCVITNASAAPTHWNSSIWPASVVGKQIKITSDSGAGTFELITQILARPTNGTLTLNDTNTSGSSQTSNKVEITALSWSAWASDGAESGIYAKGRAVTHGGSHYIANAETAAEDEPGVDAKWTAVAVVTADDAYLEDEKPYVFVNRAGYSGQAAQTQEHFGWWTILDVPWANETYMLEGYARVANNTSGAHPVIMIYGSDWELAEHLVGEVTTRMSSPATLDVATQVPKGLIDNLMYRYVLDGADAQAVAYTAGDACPWIKFRIPLTIPKPLRRVAILLSGTNTAAQVQYADPLTLVPTGCGAIGELGAGSIVHAGTPTLLGTGGLLG